MPHVLQIRADGGHLRGVLDDVIIEILFVVDLVDELVHARWRLRRATLEAVRTDDLAIVDDQLLIERCC